MKQLFGSDLDGRLADSKWNRPRGDDIPPTLACLSSRSVERFEWNKFRDEPLFLPITAGPCRTPLL